MSQTTRSLIHCVVPALLLPCLACSSPADNGHTFETIVEDGIPVAVNSAIPKFTGELFEYEKAVEIRVDPDNEETMLYRPFSLSRGPDGRYYVADYGNHRVAIFDADGNYVESIGREGEGPGEIMNPRVISFDGEVMSVEGNWLSRFTLEGEFIDEERGRRVADRSRDGHLISFPMPQGDDGTGTYMLSMLANVRSVDGAEIGELETETVAFSKVGSDKTRHEFHYAARPSIHYYAPTDELMLVPASSPELRWFTLDGTESRQARIDLGPSELTEFDRKRVLDHYDSLIQAAIGAGGEDLAEDLRNRKRLVEFADPKAYWTRPRVERSGWLWLRLPAPDIGIYVVGSQPVEQPQSFRIMDSNGEYIGDTNWPREVIRFGARLEDGYLMSMIPDRETGETIPTAYRIIPAVPGLVYPPGTDAPDS